MNIVFRVDASSEIGTGHVMRCLTLAQILKRHSSKIVFICRKHDGNMIHKIRSRGFIVEELESVENHEVNQKILYSSWLGVTQKQDSIDCINKVKYDSIDLIVIDHYAIGEEWERMLRPYCRNLMVIDDLANRKHQCNILLDQTFGRKPNDYISLVPENCNLLLGSHYALLRPEFSKWREFSLKRRKTSGFNSLLVNMGGVDLNNFTEQVLKNLENCSLPKNLKVIVVMGHSSPNLSSIESLVNNLTYNLTVLVDVENMAKLMAEADMAIGAAGSASWERCCLGLPTIQLLTAENQKTIYNALARQNIVIPLDSIEKLSKCIHELNSSLRDTALLSSSICDGLGAKRVKKKLVVL